ncbi:unnamed protein product [Phytomonas sp. EM1]|nr:unnamed protein product [Phytomonas sp. EM1]|eukprot:CCW61643.1 unnamed protein product [Phytomonas sp. isolate EM1]
MEISKYYGNPFQDDDDAVCYADISPEEVDIPTTPTSIVVSMPQHYHDSQPHHDGDTFSNLWLDLQTGVTPLSQSRQKNSNFSSPQRLQEELQQANDKILQMRCEYEDTIESLRAQVASMEDSKRELAAENNRLEKRTESLVLETELLKQSIQAERAHNDKLKGRIADLEARLKSLEYHAYQENTTTLVCERAPSISQRRRDWRDAKPATMERSNLVRDSSAHTREPLPLHQARPENDVKRLLSVKELENQLLLHCQTRDTLVGQMQRLESLRMRTAAEIKKKATTQKRLEEEEKEIGRIRLQLRSRMSQAR